MLPAVLQAAATASEATGKPDGVAETVPTPDVPLPNPVSTAAPPPPQSASLPATTSPAGSLFSMQTSTALPFAQAAGRATFGFGQGGTA